MSTTPTEPTDEPDEHSDNLPHGDPHEDPGHDWVPPRIPDFEAGPDGH